MFAKRLAHVLIVWLLFLAQISLADDRNVLIEESVADGKISLVAVLHNCSEATVTIEATLENMSSSVSMPVTVNIVSKSRQLVAVFEPIDSKVEWSYQWKFGWKYGCGLKQIPAAYTYNLPYRSSVHNVVQAAHGSFTHNIGSQDEEAVDFGMPVGTRVYPARPGVVIAIRTDSKIGGAAKAYNKDANYVVIRHSDGTYGEYLHLQAGSVLVNVGDIVTLDMPIASSGLTGFTTTPHLHFEVFYTTDGNTRVSIPLVFRSGTRVFHPVTNGIY